jgi:Cu-Zn family superoxide dismutase
MATTKAATPMAAAQVATPMAATQQATPMATPAAALDVPLIDANGDAVGLATFTEDADGVTVRLLIEGLSPGEHGWHLHEFGVCDPDGAEPFSSAGEHWNPTAQPHGAPDAGEHHVGDFGNLVASAEGLADIEITTTDFTFEAGPTSVFDEDGTSIVVHEGPDDLDTQPSGDSGPRYACGVVTEPTIDMTAMQAATPMAMATPMIMTTPEGMATPRSMAMPEDTAASPTP